MRVVLCSVLFVCVALLGTSCGNYVGSDQTEKEHPKIKEARTLVQQQDLTGAEDLLQEALRSNPDLALAHLQLGMIYQTREQPIDALYHFQRYLTARPDGEKAQILQQVVEDERRRLAAQVQGVSRSAGAEDAETEDLQARLSEAEQLLAEMEVRNQQLRIKAGSEEATPPPDWAEERLALLKQIQQLQMAGGAPSPAKETAVEGASGQTYMVKRGDTLSSIAQKAYGKASAWSKIYEANRDLIPNKNVVSPGTVLLLP